eukprot:CAMPEP_0182845098 /NCGR_PEP_ID=MMETSP0006_2-20121128/27134_1 /TAXON_ID=97485 /ORGANISM="Prymnesium parvum, Strain Texoma1" /LENGTH=73 /DNA_ID=CAMNT_0024975123 /DNA_START=70 /DNA_END=295 /DNA_ORIENTATION=-
MSSKVQQDSTDQTGDTSKEWVGEGGGLRCLTMQDFLEARTIVPPSRARFGGGPHGLGQFNLPPAPDQDVDLYD